MTTNTSIPRIERPLMILLYAALLIFGLRNGTQSVAVVYAFREANMNPGDAISLIYLVSSIGYIAAALSLGWFISRLGYNRIFIIGAALAGIGLLGWAVNPPWPSHIALELVVSAGQALITVGAIVYVATLGTPRQLIWLYVFSAIGTFFGSMIFGAVAGLIEDSGNALSTYFYLVALSGALLVIFVLVRLRWRTTMPTGDNIWFYNAWQTARTGRVWIFIALLLVASILATVNSQGEITLYQTSGSSVSTYASWIALSRFVGLAGLVIYGLAAPRVSLRSLTILSLAGILVSAGMVWLLAGDAPFSGLALMNLFTAPLFALVVLHTRELMGTYHLPGIIGLEATLGVLANYLLNSFWLRMAVAAPETTISITIVVLVVIAAGLYTLSYSEAVLRKKNEQPDDELVIIEPESR